MEHKPTLEIARKVLDTVDAGLCSGQGIAEPGHMCVEAAVCYAFGLPHGDDPPCVGKAVRDFKINLNDEGDWSDKQSRAAGMRRLAICQLGSNEIDQYEFTHRLVLAAAKTFLPIALHRSYVSCKHDENLLNSALNACACLDSANALHDLVYKKLLYNGAVLVYTAAFDLLNQFEKTAHVLVTYTQDRQHEGDSYYIDRLLCSAAARIGGMPPYVNNMCEFSTMSSLPAQLVLAKLAEDVLRELNCPGIKLLDELLPLEPKA